MVPSSSFADLDRQTRRRLLRLFNACLVSLKTHHKLTAEQVSLFMPFQTGGATDGAGRLFFDALKAMIAYFVASAANDDEIERVGSLTLSICDAVRMNFGRRLDGWPINFRTLSELRQSYWDARSRRASRTLKRHPAHPVIRVNDIPFAEAVFPALLAWHGHRNGYSVIIEDIPWNEVGPALISGRINVAMYPAYLEQQARAMKNRFPDRLLVRTDALLEYHDYPVIHNTGIVKKPGYLGVPVNSDFDLIIDDLERDGHFEAFEGTTPRKVVVTDKIKRYKSADEVLARVIDGELEYGLVGGLQAEYAERQFGKDRSIFPHSTISVCAILDHKKPSPCYLWAAPVSLPQGEKLLRPLINLWNDAVVSGWRDLVSIEEVGEEDDEEVGRRHADLVSMVNSQSHCSFVEDFAQLSVLIARHDREFNKTVSNDVKMVQPALNA